MKRIILLTGIVALPLAAIAEAPRASYVFHLAKRVADTERERDLPSRAVWLGSKAIQSSKELAKKSPPNQSNNIKSQKN